MDQEKKLRNMENTDLFIKTVGKDDVLVEASGCKVGIIYKLSIALCELYSMGALDAKGLDKVYETVKEAMHKIPKHMKKKNIKVEAIEIDEESAKSLVELLKNAGAKPIELSENIEIDLKELLKQLKED